MITVSFNEFETNAPIDDELAACPPAVDPLCPDCTEPMSTIGGSLYLLWACGNERCHNADVYLWRNGELLPDCLEVG